MKRLGRGVVIKSVVERTKEGVLKWYEHIEGMSEERLTKEIYVSEVEGKKENREIKLEIDTIIMTYYT